MAKKIVSEFYSPTIDLNKVEMDAWHDVEAAFKKLRDIAKHIDEYKKNPEMFFDGKGKYRTYDEYKRAMIKALEEVKDYLDYVSGRINGIKGKF